MKKYVIITFWGVLALINPLEYQNRGRLDQLFNGCGNRPGISILSGSVRILTGKLEIIKAALYEVFAKIVSYALNSKKFKIHAGVSLIETAYGVCNVIQGFGEFICKDLDLTPGKISCGYLSDSWIRSVHADFTELIGLILDGDL